MFVLVILGAVIGAMLVILLDNITGCVKRKNIYKTSYPTGIDADVKLQILRAKQEAMDIAAGLREEARQAEIASQLTTDYWVRLELGTDEFLQYLLNGIKAKEK
jgi:hypothetical protein